jgi:hypothetical protein
VAGGTAEDVHCQWYAWVLAYDLAEIIKQPFLNAKYVLSLLCVPPALSVQDVILIHLLLCVLQYL